MAAKCTKVKCQMCPQLIDLTNPINFFHHIRVFHSFSSNFSVQCKYRNCNQTYLVYNSFKVHWHRKHGSVLQPQNQLLDDANVLEPELQTGDAEQSNLEDTEAITNMDMEDSDDSSNVLRHSASLECMADVAAIWNPTSVTDVEWEAAALLRLRQQFYLPFEALLCVSDAIHQHHDKKLQQVKEQLIPLISDETTQSPAFNTIFNKLEGEEDLTRYRLESIWKNSFPAIMPIAVILNEGNPSFEWATDAQGKCLLKEIYEEGYLIPFLQQLQQLLGYKSHKQWQNF